MSQTDCIGREITLDDYVFSNNYIYKVKKFSTRGVVAILTNPSPTTKQKNLYAKDCCLIKSEDYLIWKLKT